MDGVTVCNEDLFPYLYMDFFWRDDALLFKDRLKPNQEINYLNEVSAQTQDLFIAIPSGVMGRLAKLTMRTTDKEGVVLYQLYPEHTMTLKLKKSKLAPVHYLTLGEILASNESDKEKEEIRKKNKT